MKQIMEHYGGAMVTGIVAFLILGMFATLSLGNKNGMSQISGGNQTSAFASYMSTAVPKVTVVDAYACVAGQWITAKECFAAVGEEAESITVTVLGGLCIGDTDGEVCVSSDGSKIYCSKPGVYRVSVTASHANGRTRDMVVKLLVNKEAVV